MGFHIGKTYFGVRWWDRHLWKRYIIPKPYVGKSYKDPYFQYYYRWLIFFWCKPRKCEFCGEYMPSTGGFHIWDKSSENVIITICKSCYEKHKPGWFNLSFNYRGDKQCITCKRSHSGSCLCREPDGEDCFGRLELLKKG